jgi:hypothetical protein
MLRAASPVTVTIQPPVTTAAIPADFIGLSFEITDLLPKPNEKYRQFSAENRPLVTLFRETGIKNLRVGGGTAEPKSGNPANDARFPVPGPRDIDQLFTFAAAADLRVIYTLRLLKGDQAQAVAIARYIAGHYASRLDSFSIGNEPDWHAYHSYEGRPMDPDIYEVVSGEPGSAYPSYLAKWRAFAAAIRQAVPNAKFSGPDTGSNYPVAGGKDTGFHGKSWTVNFAEDEKDSGLLTAILPHDYVGQSAQGVSIPTAIDAMLSRQWVSANYPALYDHVLAPVQATGLPYRMTECNDYTGGVDGASNAFASALWALDYMHWHAAHGAIGVNFHNKRWIYTDTVYLTPAGEYKINPKAYGLRAFSLGSHGRPAPVSITNADDVNLTAYAVADGPNWYVTLINKEHDAGAREVRATVVVPTAVPHAATISLLAPDGDVRAKAGITLGGGTIFNDRPWSGTWSKLALDADGRVSVNVPIASAVVVKLTK